MQKAFEKIVERLEEVGQFKVKMIGGRCNGKTLTLGYKKGIENAIKIVNQVSEEYKSNPNLIDEIKVFLKEKFDYCSEQAFMELEVECDSEIASYFRERKELYLDRANIYGEVMRVIDRLQDEHGNDGWIPCSERLPSSKEYERCNGQFIVSDGNRTYAAYFDIYDTLKFGEPTISNFRVDWRVIAWRPLPQPYVKGE